MDMGYIYGLSREGLWDEKHKRSASIIYGNK